MGSELNRSINTTAADHFGETEKRLAFEERRPRINKASDVLGPLSGPSAVLLDGSLDGALLSFNGLFVVQPGTPKSPDASKWWMGQSIAQDGLGGVQVLWTFRAEDFPHRSVMRGWEVVAGTGGLRTFSDWQSSGGSTKYEPVELDPVSPFSGTGITLTRIGDVVYASGSVARTSGSSLTFTPAVANIPIGLRPPSVQTPPATPHWVAPYGSIIWQPQITSGGTIQIRMSDAAPNVMGFTNIQWVTEDSAAGLTPA